MAVAPIRARTTATVRVARRSLTINPAAPACPASRVNRASPDAVVRVAKAVSPDRPASQANPDSRVSTAAARRSASQAIRTAAKTSSNQQPVLM
jgi:hypothetical protein